MMEWPKNILDAFDAALKIVPAEGVDKWTVLRTLLDEATRRAVAAGRGRPHQGRARSAHSLHPAWLGHQRGINGLARQLGLDGSVWGEAVDAFHSYVEENAEEVFAAFEGQGKVYGHDVGFG